MKRVKPEFTNNIRRFRFDHDEMTQSELAQEVGVTRQTIIALEANKYVPSLVLALKIAWVFSVSIEDLFSLKGWENRKS